MTVFLSLVNWAQHGFIEVDAKGLHDRNVNATTIVNGHDDYFAENHHWEHHYTHDGPVQHDADHRPASVFTRISIPELAVLMIFDKFELLAKYTDINPVVLRHRATMIER